MIDKTGFEQLFDHVTTLVAKISGNTFSEKNKQMVESRLCRRMMELDILSMKEYLIFIKNNEKEELNYLVGLLTTHHTFFFREFVHFEYLLEHLPEICKNAKRMGRDCIKIWSSACSRGHEVYSLAIFLDFHLKKINEQIDFKVYGSDIDEESILIAKRGVYSYQEVKQIPTSYLKGYWQRGKGPNKSVVRVKDHIKEKCEFSSGNLLEIVKEESVFDVVFCRNALIYFNEENIKKIVRSLMQTVVSKGVLITGVSEPIADSDLNLRKVGPCVYKRSGESVEPLLIKEEPLKLVLVDDSRSVLKILNKIFKSNKRFEVVGTCENGQELVEFLKHNKVDAVTLDLHMPVLDGVNYLRQYFNEEHPQVVVVSSVNRDDMSIARKAIEYGAFDYVEKPSLENYQECSQELISKVISACKVGKSRLINNEKVFSIEKNDKEKSLYHKEIKLLEKKLIQIDLYLFAGNSDFKNVKRVIHELHDLGVYPKGIVVEKSVEEYKQLIRDFNYPLGELKNEIGAVFVSRINNFAISSFKGSLWANKICCLFKDNDISSNIRDTFFNDAYILSEKNTGRTNEYIMPSPSWAFHIKEKYEEFELRKNTLYTINKLSKYQYTVLENEILLALYSSKETLSHVMVCSSVEQALKQVVGNSFISHYKAVGSQLKLKALSVALNGKLQELRMMVIEEEFRFFIFNENIKLNRNKFTIKMKSNCKISFTEKTDEKRVLIIDDSKVFSKILNKFITDHSDYKCVGMVHNPLELDSMISKLRPHIITLDVNMPQMKGPEVYRNVISKYKIPTIVISSSLEDNDDVIDLLNQGAIDYIHKPSLEDLSNENFPLVEKLKIAAEAKVIKSKIKLKSSSLIKNLNSGMDNKTLIAIGSSTGGTTAIRALFQNFPEKIPSVVISQHIPEYFSKTFANSLNKEFSFNVKEAEDGEFLQCNTVYIAPGGKNLEIKQIGKDLKVKISNPAVGTSFVPNVDVMFNSIAKIENYKICATILTGMGRDGAIGIGHINDLSDGCAIAQSENSCVVFGMPKAAIEYGNVGKVLDIDDIADEIFGFFNSHTKKAA